MSQFARIFNKRQKNKPWLNPKVNNYKGTAEEAELTHRHLPSKGKNKGIRTSFVNSMPIKEVHRFGKNGHLHSRESGRIGP